MSTQLEEKLNRILSEKKEKIIPENIRKGTKIFDVEGSFETLDTSDATATPQDICMNKTAYVNGEKVEGTLFELETASIATDDVVDNGSWVDIKSVLPQDYLFRKDSSITYNIAYKTLANAIGITPEKLITGNKVIGVSGNATSDADATAEDIVKGKTAYVNGEKVVGTYEETSSGDASEFNAIITANSAESSTFKVSSSLREIGDLDLTGITSMNSSFYNHIKLTKIKSISNTSQVAYMSQTFDNCLVLESIPYFDTSNVTNMNMAFNYCKSIKTIPSFNTSKVTNMSKMFVYCSNLESVPLLDTSSVTNMSYMFNYCNVLTTIPQLDTHNVSNMSYMFYYAYALQSIPLLNTSNVTNMASMFDQCSKLESVPLLDTSNVTNMNRMFTSCSTLTEIPQFNTSKVTDFGSVFNSCTKLNTIPELDASKMNNINSAFDNCTYLRNFGGLLNIGQNYTQKSANYYNYTFRLNKSNYLTYESLMNVINNLYDLNVKYNVAGGGTLYTQQLILGSTNLAKLTAEEIAIATAKRLVC